MRSIFKGKKRTIKYHALYFFGAYVLHAYEEDEIERFLELDLAEPPLQVGEYFSPDSEKEPFRVEKVVRIGNDAIGYETDYVISCEEEPGSREKAEAEVERLNREYAEKKERERQEWKAKYSSQPSLMPLAEKKPPWKRIFRQ